MATTQAKASMPLLLLEAGARIVLEAIDPATGLQVSGVAISNVAITYNPDTVVQLPSLGPKPILIRQQIA